MHGCKTQDKHKNHNVVKYVCLTCSKCAKCYSPLDAKALIGKIPPDDQLPHYFDSSGKYRTRELVTKVLTDALCTKCMTKKMSLCECGQKKKSTSEYCIKCIKSSQEKISLHNEARNQHLQLKNKYFEEMFNSNCCKKLHGKCHLKGSNGCCYCCDVRPFPEDGLYLEYHDGEGDKYTQHRHNDYCPFCKKHGNDIKGIEDSEENTSFQSK